MTSTKTYKAAAMRISKRGWKNMWPRGPEGQYMVLSAIKEVLPPDESIVDYQEAFLNRLGMHVDAWEAKRGRTQAEVLRLLRSM